LPAAESFTHYTDACTIIEGMIIKDINARLTASQALQLFEELYSQIPRDWFDSRPPFSMA
jgi:hypothetical protein